MAKRKSREARVVGSLVVEDAVEKVTSLQSSLSQKQNNKMQNEKKYKIQSTKYKIKK